MQTKFTKEYQEAIYEETFIGQDGKLIPIPGGIARRFKNLEDLKSNKPVINVFEEVSDES